MSRNTPAPVVPHTHYVTLRVGEALVGIAVTHVRDLMTARPATPVPLAHQAIAGLLPLRGQLVTAIDLRVLLDIPARSGEESAMLVVEYNGDSYALLADAAAEVVSVPTNAEEELPAQMEASWHAVAKSVYPQGEQMLVILKLDTLLDTLANSHAA